MSQIITFKGRYPGQFQDLVENGNQIFATTNNGLYYSSDGVNWNKR